MKSIMFATWDGGGNVPPAIGIARELARRGNGVRMLGHARQREAIEGAGLDFVAYEKAMPYSCLGNNTPITMMKVFGDRGMGKDLLAEYRRQPADVVVIDYMLMGALDAARRAGLPYVPLGHTFEEYFRKKWMSGPMGLSGKLRGLAPLRAIDAAQTVLVPTLAELDPATAHRQAGNLVYTGPVLDPVVPSDLGSREPTILISLSTFKFPKMRPALQAILDAVAGLPARVIVTTGPVINPADLIAGPNTEVHTWGDHDALMSQATLLIGHGGHATTMRALAHGLPMVIMPMHRMLDQTMIGTVIEQAGVGRRVGKGDSPAKLRPVIAAMLTDGPHRAAAARLAASIRANPGAPNAADRIEALIGTGLVQQ
jgi:UDP:flavonoid glycosyltransferase YjiC (YdhE family)